MGRYLVVCESEVIIQCPKAIKTGLVKYYPTRAAARNFAAAREQKNQIAMGYWDRIAIAAANLAFSLRYGEDK